MFHIILALFPGILDNPISFLMRRQGLLRGPVRSVNTLPCTPCEQKTRVDNGYSSSHISHAFYWIMLEESMWLIASPGVSTEARSACWGNCAACWPWACLGAPPQSEKTPPPIWGAPCCGAGHCSDHWPELAPPVPAGPPPPSSATSRGATCHGNSHLNKAKN